jgi:dUTP pyrophosphatase
MEKIKVAVIVNERGEVPFYASSLAAGADLKAYIEVERVINPGETALIPTGLRFAIPEGYEIQIRPRSGLALKHGVTVLNTPGTIDADYRGEVQVILINHGTVPFVVTPGMRVAQMVLAPVVQAEFVLEESLAATSRGEGGFGHTGTH